ncbi:uncharacterized protein KQ657_003947 [Scheffersomyces spartinae]|uniref:peptidylprolyl isomerase n=1 Tax=Scheffersomyces spartinae TaxID=45513 RepID=A0A9P7VBU1_9ASCO|nr:uncharacterized protein KQ657_003947 [Scheffersomyces spartinae]KAG7194845.1 hypothetical protein KQ657_003947 [Scheffersomyces spartinae]
MSKRDHQEDTSYVPLKKPKSTKISSFYPQHELSTTSVSFIASTQEKVFVGTADGTLQLWNRNSENKGSNLLPTLKKSLAVFANKPVTSVSVSPSGYTAICFSSTMQKAVVVDLRLLDVSHVVELSFKPDLLNCIFINNESVIISNKTHIYTLNTETLELKEGPSIHKSDILCLVYNTKSQYVISSDIKGLIEYWNLNGDDNSLLLGVEFQYKGQTDLVIHARLKTNCISMTINSEGLLLATLSSDNIIRIFHVPSGKVLHTIAGPLKVGTTMTFKLNQLFYSRNDQLVVYDADTGLELQIIEFQLNQPIDQFIVFINKSEARLFDNRDFLILLRTSGSQNIVVYGQTEKKTESKASPNNSQNKTIIMNTSLGQLTIKLFVYQVPKTCENFIKLCQKKYYDNVIFHRIIKGFMIQTGDPLGDGTGGESIWGDYFEDEFSGELTHCKPFMVSMANAGPNTNGSQFFITTGKAPWLDNQHSVFGEVVQGFDVVKKIEEAPTDGDDKPIDPIYILSTKIV